MRASHITATHTIRLEVEKECDVTAFRGITKNVSSGVSCMPSQVEIDVRRTGLLCKSLKRKKARKTQRQGETLE
jgi:hypothetical protein